MTELKLKRAYEPATDDDGWRVYVDRLWPRGLSHESFHYDFWAKDISPSTQLREWFHANPQTLWPEFVEKYRTELAANPAFSQLADKMKVHPIVTLLFSSHDTIHNNADVLAETLTKNHPTEFRGSNKK